MLKSLLSFQKISKHLREIEGASELLTTHLFIATTNASPELLNFTGFSERPKYQKQHLAKTL